MLNTYYSFHPGYIYGGAIPTSSAPNHRVELCHIIITNDAIHQQMLFGKAGPLGFEPRTSLLTAIYSTIEL